MKLMVDMSNVQFTVDGPFELPRYVLAADLDVRECASGPT